MRPIVRLIAGHERTHTPQTPMTMGSKIYITARNMRTMEMAKNMLSKAQPLKGK
jgi:hypothetical protein